MANRKPRAKNPLSSRRSITVKDDKREYGYKPEYCQRIMEVAIQGGWVPAMAVECGCCEKTIYNWAENHEDFKKAFTKARLLSKSIMEKYGMAGMSGELPKFNAAMWKNIMANRFPGEYKFNEDAKSLPNLTVNNISLVPNDELNKKISSLSKMLYGKDIIDAEYEEIEAGTSTSS